MTNIFEQVSALERELEGTSDRAAAVVAGAFLDEVLRELLYGFLVIGNLKSDAKLFNGTGALATFSAKIEIAFRLGLVSEGEHRVLGVIRGIRNEFAHVLGEISFSTESIRARCQNIEVPLSMIFPSAIPLSMRGEEPPLPRIEKAASNNTRAIFQEAVMTLMQSLAARLSDAQMARRVTPSDFEAAHEPAEMMAGHLRTLLIRTDALAAEVDMLEAARGRPLAEAAKPQQGESGLSKQGVAPEESRNRWRLLLQVHEFSIAQIKRAHHALRSTP